MNICEKCNEEIPEENPYCTSIKCLERKILNIEKNPEGGFFTYFENSKYPLNLRPLREDLNYVDTLKRILIATMRFIFLFPITPHKIIIGAEKWMSDIYSADNTQHPNRFILENLTESSQEILRCLILTDGTGDCRWCWYLSAIWDTDLAYGLRGKDGLQLLNKQALQKNPKHEIIRLVDIVIARDKSIQSKLKMAKKMLKIALLSKEFRKIAVNFLMNLDIEKMKFNINERYWLANKFDYNYEGKSYEERMAWKNEEDKDWIPPEIQKEVPRIAINPPNKAFYNLKEEEKETMINETARLLRENWKQNQNDANTKTA
jgi:hypothetical protein